jgi:hypothetical protein
MATSTLSEIKNTINMKARKLFALLTMFVLSTISLFSQSYLIAPDPPNNIYPITFTGSSPKFFKYYTSFIYLLCRQEFC